MWLLYGEGREIGREGGREGGRKEREGQTVFLLKGGARDCHTFCVVGGWVGGVIRFTKKSKCLKTRQNKWGEREFAHGMSAR